MGSLLRKTRTRILRRPLNAYRTKGIKAKDARNAAYLF